VPGRGFSLIPSNIASLCEVARQFHRTESSLRESVKRHFNYL
jgi:hypothetical protein